MSEETPPDPGPPGAIGAAVGQFAALAARGAFAVNEHGGQALLKPIRDMVAWIDDQRDRFEVLRNVAKLGSSTNAEVMKPFLQDVAGDEAGFITQVLLLRVSLIAAEEAILQAMASYQQSDDQAADRLGER
ncbi:hypothetical protein [Actinokineospora cianjurensis]|uniref:Uncharacterized protein n=1 Tax=Actinokineospora cianjurensis TaxID=585224 RepID=A0A421BCY9_9PSEU|nr:hypothetical protein [Actinokineospora cianjurensis]RLK62242.1 hypothetical protein CLV68_2798 [Actinokineospora cianjurensis]